MSNIDLSLIIPAYNEAAHMEGVIANIADIFNESGVAYEIRVVNNGSNDATPEVLSRLSSKYPTITSVTLARNQGYGGGILDGLRGARGAVIGWAHADGQADPHDILKLLREMKSNKKTLGKAVRVVRMESPWRIIQSRIYHVIFQTLFWTPYRDIHGTPKLMTQESAKILNLKSRDWFIEAEFVIKAIRYGLPIQEIDTIWRSRKSGSTRAHLLTGLEFFKNMFLYRIGVL